MEESVVDFVVKLNTQRIKREFGAEDSVNEDCDDENKTNTSADAKACYKTGTSPYQDDYLDDLLEMDPDDAFADDKSNECTLSDATNEFRTKIETELTQYTMYCATVDWNEMITLCPTDKFKKLSKSNEIDVNLIKKKNPRYSRQLFDVIGWWLSVGYKLFPRLSVVANIVLAKAAHNGFQERVFSIGTFMDTKHQKRRIEENYEMDVLQKINSSLLTEDDYYEELDELAKTTPAVTDDVKKIKTFFSVTEEVQEILASKSSEEKEYASESDIEDDEESVEDEDVSRTEEEKKIPVYDMTMLIDLDTEEDDGVSITENDIGSVNTTMSPKQTEIPFQKAQVNNYVPMNE